MPSVKGMLAVVMCCRVLLLASIIQPGVGGVAGSILSCWYYYRNAVALQQPEKADSDTHSSVCMPAVAAARS
jgi:hypothetical protein